MFELALLIVGGFVGVFCDRLWQRVEKRTRLSIEGAYHVSGIEQEEGVLFTVKNLGKEQLPPIKLGVFAPGMGSCFIFPVVNAEFQNDELWPGQKREFLCRVTRSHPSMLKNIAQMANNPKIVFQIQLVNGDTVIFQNHRIGRAIALLFAAQVDGPGMGHVAGGLWGELNYKRMGLVARIRHKLYIRSVLKKAAIATKTTKQIES